MYLCLFGVSLMWFVLFGFGCWFVCFDCWLIVLYYCFLGIWFLYLFMFYLYFCYSFACICLGVLVWVLLALMRWFVFDY